MLVKRIVAVSEYSKALGREVSLVAVKDLGNGSYVAQSLSSYKQGHYIRGVAEILGLGVILIVLECVESILRTLVVLTLVLTTILTLITAVPIACACAAILDRLPRKQIINLDVLKKEKNASDFSDKNDKENWLEQPIALLSLFKNILKEKPYSP
ncbi:hypothetical protein [Chlamydia felis Fe/C-56]|uniref:Uncharacterized protein n=1 Tax=Chlamydia felis (strain Fe/C-56) TaxID=264202 RepID=Q254L2_CHLFF|nr:hypothetical protein [Chlamydia felis Fe/C-56]